jgi:hypothetical protein
MEAVDLSPNVANSMLTQVMQTGQVAQNNFVTVAKLTDYDYMEGKRVIGLTEAVGVREVASKSVPAGPSSPE